jgi:signal transduction histidine kinase
LIEADPGRIDELARRATAGAAAHHAPGPLGAGRALLRVERVEGAPGVGAIAVAHSTEPIERMLRRAAIRLIVAGGAIAAAVAGLALWASRRLGEGLGGLVAATERVAAGELGAPIDDGPRFFEFPRVARAFRAMTAALADARARLERTEESRRELERRVLHAQALAVVGQVSSAFAHELGSPLSTILGQARLAAADESLAPGARAAFDSIATQSERITRMVQRVLSVARLPRERKEAVDLTAVIHEATTFLAPDLRARRVDLRLDLAPDAPSVLAVRDLLLQVLVNLVANAADAQAGEGGVIRVALAADRDDPEDPHVRLEVADTGPGVPAELRARIFEPFYSTRAESGGTGLGLAVVADVVRDLGGRVSVGDAPEGGALFTVTLPAHVI